MCVICQYSNTFAMCSICKNLDISQCAPFAEIQIHPNEHWLGHTFIWASHPTVLSLVLKNETEKSEIRISGPDEPGSGPRPQVLTRGL